MKAPAATLLLLGVISTGCGEPAQTGNAIPPRLTLHTVTLPRALPNWAFHRFGALCHQVGCTWDGVGVEANGDILVAVGEADECCYLYGFVRFDPRRRQWVSGAIVNPTAPGGCFVTCFPAMVLPVGLAVWMIDRHSGSVYRGRFGNGWSTPRKVVRAGPRRPWGIVNVLTPDRQGRVWVVGSTDPSCAAQVAANSVCGRSLVGLAGRTSRQVPAIRASRSGTATDAAVGPGGSLWLLVPRFRHCPHSSCGRSALIRYDPAKRRIARHMIPGALWPDIGTLGGGDNNGWVYAEPSGTVWVGALVNRGLRVIQFHHGSFSSHIVRLPASTRSFRPPMDRNGDIWFCNSTAHTVTVVEPRTGQSTKLRNRPGTSLLEDTHGEMWYVKGHQTGWSDC